MKDNISSVERISKNENGHCQISITYHQTFLQRLFRRPCTTEVYVDPTGEFKWFEKETLKRASKSKEFLIYNSCVWLKAN